MSLLSPGAWLKLKRSAAGLGEETLDVSVLPKGLLVRYVRPVSLLVRLPDENEVVVPVDCLEFTDGK